MICGLVDWVYKLGSRLGGRFGGRLGGRLGGWVVD